MRVVRAARWTAAGDLLVQDLRVADPGAGEIQVAIGRAGLCGSDLHFFRGEFRPKEGVVPGHELGGTVSAVGAGVRQPREGDLVGVEPILRCGRCRYCQAGLYHRCVTRRLVGEDVDGAMGELVNVPAYTAFAAPPGVDAEVVALAEPLACAIHAYGKAQLRRGETVLVVGAGSIGLLALLAAKAEGARCLIVARHAHQRQAAQRLGADEVIADDEAGRARLGELAREEAIDVSLESVGGLADTILLAQHAVRRFGRLLVLGVSTAAVASIDPRHLVGREIEIMGAVTYCAPQGKAEYGMALEMLADHAEEARSLVTHRFALADVTRAFETALDKSSRSIKVHVDPSG